MFFLFYFFVLFKESVGGDQFVSSKSNRSGIINKSNNEFDSIECCKERFCFRKCCPIYHVIGQNHLKTTKEICLHWPDKDILIKNGVPVSNKTKVVKNLALSEVIILFGWTCVQSNTVKLTEGWGVQENGSLYTNDPPSYFDNYCVETYVDENNQSSLIALAHPDDVAVNQEELILNCICMLISCIFILATLAVYAVLPELQNLHGKVLIVYLSCLLVWYAFTAAQHILMLAESPSRTRKLCTVFTFVVYFSFMSSLFWLNIMSFDIWWTFSGKRGLSLERLSSRARFAAYCLYAFGIPTLLTTLTISLVFTSNIVTNKCFILASSFAGGSDGSYYVFGPMLVLSLANLVFFTLTTIKIAKVNKQTSVLRSKDSSSHNTYDADKQRLAVYFKLFAIMGISWIIQVISENTQIRWEYWIIPDLYNLLTGLIIFIVFICKKKTLQLVRRR